jgi:hypothetical protein
LQPRSAAAALDPAIFSQWTEWLQIPAGVKNSKAAPNDYTSNP